MVWISIVLISTLLNAPVNASAASITFLSAVDLYVTKLPPEELPPPVPHPTHDA
jgi:hypothetical protein